MFCLLKILKKVKIKVILPPFSDILHRAEVATTRLRKFQLTISISREGKNEKYAAIKVS